MGYIASCSLPGTRHVDGVSEDLVFVQEDRLLCVADGMSEGRGRMIPAEIRSQIETHLLPQLDQTAGMWEWTDHQRMMRTLSDFVARLNERVVGIGSKACIVLVVRGKPGSPCVYVYSLGDVGCYLGAAGLSSWGPIHFPEASREEQRSGTGALQRYLGMKDLPQVEACCSLVASPNYCSAKVIRHFALHQRFYLLDQGGALVVASDGVWGGFGDPGRFREKLAQAVGTQPETPNAVNVLTGQLRDSTGSGGDDCSLALWVLGEEGDFRRPMVDEGVHQGIARFCGLAKRVPIVADAFATYGERLRGASAPAEVGEQLIPAWQIYSQAREAPPAIQDVALLTASVAGEALVREKRLRDTQALLTAAQAGATEAAQPSGQAQDTARDLDLALAVARQIPGQPPSRAAVTPTGEQLVDHIQRMKSAGAAPAPGLAQPANLYRDDLLLAQEGVDAARAADITTSAAVSVPGRELLNGIRNVKAKHEQSSQWLRELIYGLQEASGHRARLAKITEHTVRFYQDWLAKLGVERGTIVPDRKPPEYEPGEPAGRGRKWVWSWSFAATAIGAIIFAATAGFFAMKNSTVETNLARAEEKVEGLETKLETEKKLSSGVRAIIKERDDALNRAEAAEQRHKDLRNGIVETIDGAVEREVADKMQLPGDADADEGFLTAIAAAINHSEALGLSGDAATWKADYEQFRGAVAKIEGKKTDFDAALKNVKDTDDRKFLGTLAGTLNSLKSNATALNKANEELQTEAGQKDNEIRRLKGLLANGQKQPPYTQGAGYFVVWLDKAKKIRVENKVGDAKGKEIDALRNKLAWAEKVSGQKAPDDTALAWAEAMAGKKAPTPTALAWLENVDTTKDPKEVAAALSEAIKTVARNAGHKDVDALENDVLNPALKPQGKPIDFIKAIKDGLVEVSKGVGSKAKLAKYAPGDLPAILQVEQEDGLRQVWGRVKKAVDGKPVEKDAKVYLWYCLADEIQKELMEKWKPVGNKVFTLADVNGQLGQAYEDEWGKEPWSLVQIEGGKVREQIRAHLAGLVKSPER